MIRVLTLAAGTAVGAFAFPYVVQAACWLATVGEVLRTLN